MPWIRRSALFFHKHRTLHNLWEEKEGVTKDEAGRRKMRCWCSSDSVVIVIYGWFVKTNTLTSILFVFDFLQTGPFNKSLLEVARRKMLYSSVWRLRLKWHKGVHTKSLVAKEEFDPPVGCWSTELFPASLNGAPSQSPWFLISNNSGQKVK